MNIMDIMDIMDTDKYNNMIKNKNNSEKDIIRMITKEALFKNFYCHHYAQNEYIEYRSNEYPFKTFRYNIKNKEILY